MLEREKGNLRAAMEWLLDGGKVEEALRIVAALEKTTIVSRESNELFSTEVKARVFSVADYSALHQNDLDSIIHEYRNQAVGSTESSSLTFGELTTREVEVLRLLSMGLSNKLIAERLVISPHTVSGHIQSIFSKLALNSRSAATRYALEHHLT